MPALVAPHRREQEGLPHLSPEGRDEPGGRQVHGQVEGVLAARAEAHDEQEEREEGRPMIPGPIVFEGEATGWRPGACGGGRRVSEWSASEHATYLMDMAPNGAGVP